MSRFTFEQTIERRLSEMSPDERAEYEEGRRAVELAFQIGSSIRELRELAMSDSAIRDAVDDLEYAIGATKASNEGLAELMSTIGGAVG